MIFSLERILGCATPQTGAYQTKNAHFDKNFFMIILSFSTTSTPEQHFLSTAPPGRKQE